MAERGRPRSFDRAAALRQAMEVFWAKGYSGTSMADLTAAMKINSPSIYAAFGCKEELFREAVVLYGATEGARIWERMTAAPSARAAIETMLRVSAEDYTRPGKPRGCLVVLGAIHADDGNDAVQRELRQKRVHNVDLLARRLERAVAEGELPEGVDCRAVATFYATVQHGMSIQARDGVSRKSLLNVADCAMVAWDGLVAARGNTGKS
ncbi:TetR/AcrR family transcriptional regulator [Bradyrhizobium sp. LHD-71]|uniref:TetR/AcrR family transcriptional regulator n=1 Tax=Bradyrhizobium sp. LHD-71 TaxID=3072141 RepID=UPI00280CC24B|nr:TetR/AcrR family transcriptional regulator [Bradyrhizobium sp. LHD-71]MDQ8730213.1 TetR/AcrR family transcriptional regulator [Bradyrhizobium sp. LHD-71]